MTMFHATDRSGVCILLSLDGSDCMAVNGAKAPQDGVSDEKF